MAGTLLQRRRAQPVCPWLLTLQSCLLPPHSLSVVRWHRNSKPDNCTVVKHGTELKPERDPNYTTMIKNEDNKFLFFFLLFCCCCFGLTIAIVCGVLVGAGDDDISTPVGNTTTTTTTTTVMPALAARATPPASASHLDLIRAPYVLYGVKYIGLVSLATPPASESPIMNQNDASSGFEICFAPSTTGADRC